MGMDNHLLRVCLCCAAFAACGTTGQKIADLATNPEIYTDVAFTTPVPGDRTAFLAPLAEARRADVLPAGLGGFPIVYDDESRWERPLPAMLDEVLRRQLAASHLFASFADAPANAQLVIAPSLVTFLTGAMELASGARSLCELGLRVQVYGPQETDGRRPLLHDQIYGERQLSEPAMRTPSRVLLAGRVLHATVQKLLQGLDGSNVGRTGMPATATGPGITTTAVPAPAAPALPPGPVAPAAPAALPAASLPIQAR